VSIVVSEIKNQSKCMRKKFYKLYLIYLPLDTTPIDMGYWLVQSNYHDSLALLVCANSVGSHLEERNVLILCTKALS
jgi:hypothetical protein